MNQSTVTITDQFCGAGGSSVGASRAGAEIKLALNHWKLAVETHNSNFPDTDHDCTDISACDPRRYNSTTILITSPECTNHTLAKGKARKHQKQLDLFGKNQPDPAEERSRATMWDVCRFAEFHRYQLIIVENVIDARYWGLWDAWIHAMTLLGYDHQIIYFNSMFAWPTPQSRDRMYVVFWRAGNRAPNLDFRPLAHCAHCERDVDAVQSWKNQRWGRYKKQYIYRCPQCAAAVEPLYYSAATCIDWSLPIQKIADRPKPLSDKTIRRIEAGLNKFGSQPMTVELAYTHAPGHRCTPISGSLPTQTSRQTAGLLVPPFMIDLRGTNAPREMAEAVSTICASGNHHGLVVPLVISYYGTGGESSVGEPLPTVTTVDRHALVMTPPLLIGNYTPGWARPVSEPTGTITTADHHSLVVPPFLVSYYTRPTGIGAAVSGVDKAMPTQPTWPVHYLAQPGETPRVEDCGFRMLQPGEIHRAMAFPNDYIVKGNARERVRQYGNAVTPPVMEMIVRRCIESLRA